MRKLRVSGVSWMTSVRLAREFLRRFLTSSGTANLRLSATWKRISGVLTRAGIAPRSSVTDWPRCAAATIRRIAP